jgi:hypothetical protein
MAASGVGRHVPDRNPPGWKWDRDYVAFNRSMQHHDGAFAFWYSAVFDHNPQFDAIQPDRTTTPSFVGEQEEYRRYLLRHYGELIGTYQPDAMTFDWYWPDGSSEVTVETFRSRYPDVVVTFNLANLFPASTTSGSSAHRQDDGGRTSKCAKIPTNCGGPQRWCWPVSGSSASGPPHR